MTICREFRRIWRSLVVLDGNLVKFQGYLEEFERNSLQFVRNLVEFRRIVRSLVEFEGNLGEF